MRIDEVIRIYHIYDLMNCMSVYNCSEQNIPSSRNHISQLSHSENNLTDLSLSSSFQPTVLSKHLRVRALPHPIPKYNLGTSSLVHWEGTKQFPVTQADLVIRLKLLHTYSNHYNDRDELHSSNPKGFSWAAEQGRFWKWVGLQHNLRTCPFFWVCGDTDHMHGEEEKVRALAKRPTFFHQLQVYHLYCWNGKVYFVKYSWHRGVESTV